MAPKINIQVENIISLLETKKNIIKVKIDEYNSPIMIDLIKNSPHLQLEYTRLNATHEVVEDLLITIRELYGIKKPIKNAKGK